MKNLLVYINPSKTFFGKEKGSFRDCTPLVKIQIDNSLSLGWAKKDIMLFTNFDYEYQGIKAMPIDSSIFCTFRPLSTKTLAVSYLLDNNILKNNELYWVHDFDAFQLNRFTDQDVNLGKFDIGISDYGYNPKWSMGSIFFKTSAKDIFKLIKKTVYEYQAEDERALSHITNHKIGGVLERIKRLNITFNFGMREVGHNFNIATKPLKVLHFHPAYYLRDSNLKAKPLEIFMYGKNELGKPLMSKRLIKIFNENGIR